MQGCMAGVLFIPTLAQQVFFFRLFSKRDSHQMGIFFFNTLSSNTLSANIYTYYSVPWTIYPMLLRSVDFSSISFEHEIVCFAIQSNANGILQNSRDSSPARNKSSIFDSSIFSTMEMNFASKDALYSYMPSTTCFVQNKRCDARCSCVCLCALCTYIEQQLTFLRSKYRGAVQIQHRLYMRWMRCPQVLFILLLNLIKKTKREKWFPGIHLHTFALDNNTQTMYVRKTRRTHHYACAVSRSMQGAFFRRVNSL